MLVPPTEGLRVAKYASGAGYAPDQWARALAAVDWDKAELLSDKPRSSVWRAELVVQKRPMTLVIKCEPIDSLKRKLQKLVHKTHAFRHWRGAELLMRHGFRTAEPKAIVFGRRDGVEIECLIMEAVVGRSLLERLSNTSLSVRNQHQLASCVGAWTRSLWEKGIHNRDHKGSNIIVPIEGDAPPALIDCIGLRYQDRLGRKLAGDRKLDLEAMLAKIVIEARGCGVPIRHSLLLRGFFGAYGVEQRRHLRADAVRYPKARRKWRKFRNDTLEDICWDIDTHGDPTPEHNPLGRASETSPERE